MKDSAQRGQFHLEINTVINDRDGRFSKCRITYADHSQGHDNFKLWADFQNVEIRGPTKRPQRFNVIATQPLAKNSVSMIRQADAAL